MQSVQPGEQSTQKYIWLLTYGAGGPIIDANTFTEYGRLEVDECYTTVDRALRYSLVHLKAKNRDTALQRFMVYCSQKYGIVQQEIFGYSSVSGNSASSELYDHPAFRVLLKHKLESRPCFSLWVEAPGLRGGGILEPHARRISASLSGQNLLQVDHEGYKDPEESESTEGGSVAQVLWFELILSF
jgi:hypothetical protein